MFIYLDMLLNDKSQNQVFISSCIYVSASASTYKDIAFYESIKNLFAFDFLILST